MAMAIRMVIARTMKVMWLPANSKASIHKISARLLGFSLIVFTGNAVGGDWSGEGSITYAGSYTDNVSLSKNDTDSKIIPIITPQISVNGDGSRAKFDLISSVQFSKLSGENQNVNPRLQSSGKVELLEDFFFLDANARAYQVAINPFRPSGEAGLNRTDNSTTTYNVSIAPYIKTRLSPYANVEARYQYDTQWYSNNKNDSGDRIDDADHRRASVKINSSDEFTRLSWSVVGDYVKTNYDTEGFYDSDYKSAGLNLGYQINRQFRVTGSFGKEWNDYISYRSDIDDTYWNSGAVWEPNKRTSLEAGYGHRYFGSTPYFEIKHKTRKTRLKFGYSKSITDASDLRFVNDVFPTTDPLGQPQDSFIWLPFFGQPEPVDDFTTAPQNGLRLDERFEASLTVVGTRSSVTFRARRSKQTREDNDLESKFDNLSVIFNRDISRVTSFNTGVHWNKRKDEETGANSDRYRLNVGLEYAVGSNSSWRLFYSYTNESGNFDYNEYQENRISVAFTLGL